MSYYEIYLDDELLCSSDWNEGILDPSISKEINKAGEMEFTILPSHSKWDKIYPMKSRIDVFIRGKNVFRGRIKDFTMDMYKQKQVSCEGGLAWFVDFYKQYDKERYLELYWTFKDRIQVDIDNIVNNGVETYKHFSVGICEPGFYSENLLHKDKLIDGYYDSEDGNTIDASVVATSNSDYIPFDKEKKYYLTVNEFSSPSYDDPRMSYFLYDSSKEFIGAYSSNSLYYDAIKDHWDKATADRVAYLRVSSEVSRDTLFWLSEYYFLEEEEVDEKNKDDYETWGGGQFSDYITNWLVDGRNMMIRHRVSDTGENILDVLHPTRNDIVAEIEFARNILDLNLESSDREPYSIIVPLFGDDGDVIQGFVVEIPEAIEKYGRIEKGIEFGKQPSSEKDFKKFWDKVATYKKLYDPTVPSKYTIKALDDGIFFDNDAMTLIDVGDPVHVISDPHGLDRTLLCLDMKLDLNNPANNEYGIGIYAPDDPEFRVVRLTDRWKKDTKGKKSIYTTVDSENLRIGEKR